jgi:hypothetical protein
MKNSIALFSILVLAGCASSPIQGYRPADTPKQFWQIDGDFNPLNRAVKIRVDGQQVIAGKFPFLSRQTDLSGSYKGRPVTASCSQTAGLLGFKTQCMVFVNNERAMTLQF